MLTLSSYLEERAAKLQREALGRIQVSMAGAPPGLFYSIMDLFFGYTDNEDPEKEEDTAMAPCTAAFCLPAHLTSVRGKASTAVSGASAGSESETPKESTKPHANLAVLRALVFKPGPNSRTWSRTGLPKEFQPVRSMDTDKYGCPMCPKYEPRSNIDTVATHIRRDHLNIVIRCHFCAEAFFTCEAWKSHSQKEHNCAKNEYMPEGAGEPGVYKAPTDNVPELPTDIELDAIKQEEELAVAEAAGLANQDLDIEPETVEEDIEIMEV